MSNQVRSMKPDQELMWKVKLLTYPHLTNLYNNEYGEESNLSIPMVLTQDWY